MTDKFDKKVDLHESEWAKEDKKQPVLGRNGFAFLVMLPSVLVIGFCFKWLFNTCIETFGTLTGVIVASAIAWTFALFLVGPTLSALFGLADWLFRKTTRR